MSFVLAWPKRLAHAVDWRVEKCLRAPLRKLGAAILPAGRAERYEFDRAREYWRNVPRAEGGHPFNTADLPLLSDEQLLRDVEREMAIARDKPERRIGLSRAMESIAAINAPRVMDYGSGIGFYGFGILERHPGAHVTFADINESNLTAIRRIAGLKGMEGRVDCLPVRDEQARDLIPGSPFDLMASMGVLHHTPYARQIVQHLTPFLKRGGIFLVMLYNYTYLRQEEAGAGRRLNVASFGARTDPEAGHMSNPYSEPYDDAKAKRLFEGYELIGADHPNPCYNTYRFRKPPG